MTKRAGVLCFQIERMHSVRRNQHEISRFAGDFLVCDIHTAAAGGDEIDLDGLVDVFCKGVTVLPYLVRRTDDGLCAEKKRITSRKVGGFRI